MFARCPETVNFMKYNPDKHHRRSIRLKDCDYAQQGAYFVTICAHQKTCLFGGVVDDRVILNETGEIVMDEWLNTAVTRPYVELDAFVVMPNHFHGILFIIDDPLGSRGMARHAPMNHPRREFGKPVPGALPTIIGAFKSAVTRSTNVLRNTPGAPV